MGASEALITAIQMAFITYINGTESSIGQGFSCGENIKRIREWKLDVNSSYGRPSFKV